MACGLAEGKKNPNIFNIYRDILLIFCQLLKGFTTSKSTVDEISPG
jgi:hypothetical protein